LPVGTSEGGRTFLRTDTRSPLLSSYVELAQPATRKQIAQLGDATACRPTSRRAPAAALDLVLSPLKRRPRQPDRDPHRAAALHR